MPFVQAQEFNFFYIYLKLLALEKLIDILMGDDVAPRKEFITNKALEVVNLDI